MEVPSIFPNGFGADLTSAGAADGDAVSADRFLKLLVTQMQNQDPLNPLDNAQVTSQMAQINTVTSIEKLNSTVESLAGQFVQLQALQGASLVGREVAVPGDKLSVRDGVAQGSFELAGPADSVAFDVLDRGLVVGTIIKKALGGGIHSFNWEAGDAYDEDSDLRFRVAANSGATNATVTTLMHDRVEAVITSADTLTLELQQSGHKPYSALKSFN